MTSNQDSATTLRCAPDGQLPTDIRIGPQALAAVGPAGFSLVDERVAALHADALTALGASARDPASLCLTAGEGAKSIATLESVLRAMATSGLDRRSTLRVIGGGTIGDLGGLAAALYMRGIRFEQVPTTLLSMVDSSVGGKTAINLPEAKNLVGTFWPAESVFIDPRFVATLDEDDFRSGLGEVLKMAIGLEPELFEFCETECERILARDTGAIHVAIELALRAKIRVVESDFREAGDRRLLNLGHTLGHALESARDYAIPHGVAVARGIHYALELAESHSTLEAADRRRATALLESFGFHTDAIEAASALLPFLSRDKKREHDQLHAVLPDGIGSSRVVAMSVDDFARLLPR